MWSKSPNKSHIFLPTDHRHCCTQEHTCLKLVCTQTHQHTFHESELPWLTSCSLVHILLWTGLLFNFSCLKICSVQLCCWNAHKAAMSCWTLYKYPPCPCIWHTCQWGYSPHIWLKTSSNYYTILSCVSIPSSSAITLAHALIPPQNSWQGLYLHLLVAFAMPEIQCPLPFPKFHMCL